MATLGEKTHVSCLQEYLVSKNMIPHYELVHNGVGTHNPTFTYRVKAGDLWEEGTGRSKKEAKHKAAEKMLKSLHVIDCSIAEEDDANDSLREIGENYVGELKEFCLNQNYPTPKYYVEEAGGPPHARIFKMICCVSQLKDSGISTTKKHAKQQAAQKMLQCLKTLKGKTLQEHSNSVEVKAPTEAQKSPLSEEIIEKFNSLKSVSVPIITKDPAVLYKDHHKAFIDLHKTSVTLLNLMNGTTVASTDNALSLLCSIAQELEVSITTSKIPSVETNKTIFIITITLFPPIASVGESEADAALNVLNSLLYLCKE